MTDLKLVLTPARAAVLAGTRSKADVLVRLQSPPRPAGSAGTRAPVHLALVIDRSGSMAGQPLAEARRCAQMVVDALRAEDRVAVVAYESEVTHVTGLLSGGDKRTLQRAIAGIHEGGCTNLHGGWLAGAEELAPHTRAGLLSRVILLSDGQANQGLTEMDAICGQVTELAAAGVTTSTYGLSQHFNESLMTAMADAGRGNAYYGQTADDLADPFREELALLEALCARQVKLAVKCPDGVSVEVLNGYGRTPDGAWRLPDVAYEGEAWALLRLTIEPQLSAGRAAVELLEVKARWHDLEGQAGESTSLRLELPVMPAAAYAAVAEDPLVRRRVEEITVAGYQERARDAARRRDWGQVNLTLEQARLESQDNPWLLDVVGELQGIAARRDEESFAKEAVYSARRARTRLTSNCEVADHRQQLNIPAFVRRKKAQGKAEPPRGKA